MNYQDFLKSLDSTRYTDEDYYTALVFYKEDILLDIAKTNQGVVAKRLRVNPTKLSFMLNILKLDISLSSEVKARYDNYTTKL